jgi:pSer/pThr/pTyr-binding forkhead associated (FHA) protein
MPAWQTPAPAPEPVAPAPAPEPDAGQTVALPGAAAGPAGELTIEAGPDQGHTYRLSGDALRIGRSPDNDLILRDPATSGHHARLERRSAQFFVVDLGSTNGTLVNGEPVQERELHSGDRVTIGQNLVRFSIL